MATKTKTNQNYMNEKRNSNGQFVSNGGSTQAEHKMSGDDGRKNNPKNVSRNAQGQFVKEK